MIPLYKDYYLVETKENNPKIETDVHKAYTSGKLLWVLWVKQENGEIVDVVFKKKIKKNEK